MPAKFNFTVNIDHTYTHKKSYHWLLLILAFCVFLALIYLIIYYLKKRKNNMKKNKIEKNWYNKMLELNYSVTS